MSMSMPSPPRILQLQLWKIRGSSQGYLTQVATHTKYTVNAGFKFGLLSTEQKEY